MYIYICPFVADQGHVKDQNIYIYIYIYAHLSQIKAILKNRGVFGSPQIDEQIKELEEVRYDQCMYIYIYIYILMYVCTEAYLEALKSTRR